MGSTQFRYNPKTLRYERVRFSVWRAGVTLMAYLSFGFLFFFGLNLIQNFLIETSLEKSLKDENKSLTEYKAVLTAQLEESNLSLKKLTSEEEQLHEKLFEAPAEPVSQPLNSISSTVINTEDFSEAFETVEGQFKTINKRATNTNQFLNSRFHVKKSDVTDLINLPSIAPVENLSEENLVSGFGIRINPFHKGNYHHDGIDIALPKETQVIATGNGRVSSYSYSNLEAGYGNYIEIDHGNGYITRYSHLEKIAVSWGQKIQQGQAIGLSGSSGGSVAPHLHYEIIRNGKNVDPLIYIIEGISSALHQELSVKGKIQNQSLD